MTRRADPDALARFQTMREVFARARERRRVAEVPRPKGPSPSEQVREAELGRVTPMTFANLTRIANDPRRSATLRVRAANAILKIGHGAPENADG